MKLNSENIAELAEKIYNQLREEQKEEILKSFGNSGMTPEEITATVIDLSETFSTRFTVLLLQALSASDDSDVQ